MEFHIGDKFKTSDSDFTSVIIEVQDSKLIVERVNDLDSLEFTEIIWEANILSNAIARGDIRIVY